MKVDKISELEAVPLDVALYHNDALRDFGPNVVYTREQTKYLSHGRQGGRDTSALDHVRQIPFLTAQLSVPTHVI